MPYKIKEQNLIMQRPKEQQPGAPLQRLLLHIKKARTVRAFFIARAVLF